MTITNRVQGAFFSNDSDSDDARLIRLAPNAPPSRGPTRRQGRPWTHEEHDRFLQAMEIYPSGPWKIIAEHVGTRTTRQTMTHGQKYRQKIERWKRGASIKPAYASYYSGSVSSPSSSVASADERENDANEDAVFWEILDDILKVGDSQYFEEIMEDTRNVRSSTQTPVSFSAHVTGLSYSERGVPV